MKLKWFETCLRLEVLVRFTRTGDLLFTLSDQVFWRYNGFQLISPQTEKHMWQLSVRQFWFESFWIWKLFSCQSCQLSFCESSVIEEVNIITSCFMKQFEIDSKYLLFMYSFEWRQHNWKYRFRVNFQLWAIVWILRTKTSFVLCCVCKTQASFNLVSLSLDFIFWCVIGYLIVDLNVTVFFFLILFLVMKYCLFLGTAWWFEIK